MGSLLTWVGFADIRAAKGDPGAGLGPIGQVLEKQDFTHVILLMDDTTWRDRSVVRSFFKKIANEQTKFDFRSTKLDNPIDFRAIYVIAASALDELLEEESRPQITIHLSPGTPAMAAVWILLSAKSGQAVELIQTSVQRGVEAVSLPFDIYAEYVPELVRGQSRRVSGALTAPHIESPDFSDILFKSDAMRRVVERASIVAVYDVPVLIQGESGTGKEMFAKAISKRSQRSSERVVSINCGAIPKSLMESLLFGHEKGSFTGALKDAVGYFESANKGTLFLDEIGELPASAQKRLLRVLQEEKIQRIGSQEEVQVDVRVIAATNRNLKEDVRRGKFRKDLYYRIAVTSIVLPPLREREGDLTLLTDALLAAAIRKLGAAERTLSPGARSVLAAHSWPGNVRELQGTLTRAIIWSRTKQISKKDMEDAIEYAPVAGEGDILSRPLGDGFDLESLLSRIKEDYTRRALDESFGNKTKAAELLGYKQQTFSSYLKKHGLG